MQNYLNNAVKQLLAAYLADGLAINPVDSGWHNQAWFAVQETPLFLLVVIPETHRLYVVLGEPSEDLISFGWPGWTTLAVQRARSEYQPLIFKGLDTGSVLTSLANCRIEIPNLDLQNLPDFDVELAAVPWLDPDKFLDLVPYLTIKSTPPATVDLTDLEVLL